MQLLKEVLLNYTDDTLDKLRLQALGWFYQIILKLGFLQTETIFL